MARSRCRRSVEVIGHTIVARDIGDRLRLDQALRTTEAALASRHRLGTGLGLSIAKRLVELHGGTVVTVELPMAPGRLTQLSVKN